MRRPDARPAPPAAAARSEDSLPPVSLYATGWNAALRRPIRIKTEGASVQLPRINAVTLVNRPQPIQVNSYRFASQKPSDEAATVPVPNMLANRNASSESVNNAPAAESNVTATSKGKRTRFQPPKDTIRLQDRLFYLLQPPVESWLDSASLEFPFRPFPYQYAGVAFLYPRFAAVLADEMGLGKTMQAITTIRMLLRSGELNSVVLICPKPLVTNWQREFALWAPEIPIAVISGNQQRRAFQWREESVPVRIANYELLIRDEPVLTEAGLEFDLVVLDEAQRIKNTLSSTSRVARSIRRQRSWALTGTPIENSTEDLVGIFDFVSPGTLCSEMNPRRMGQVAGDCILRRTKDLVLEDLPPKLFRDPAISLTAAQLESYEMAESQGVLRLTEMGESVSIQHVFELVLRLKQICNFDPATGDSAKADRLEADLEEIAASGKKAIVFSQWVDSIEKLSDRLKRFQPLEYHGKIPSGRRDGILQAFRENPDHPVLLMSYGAGSVGLNLQFASYVFLFDRWWNPAVEDQAINRAHRIGAVGPVTVTRFLTPATIEERIDCVLQEKRELFNAVLSQAHAPTAGERSGLSQSEIFGLFDLKLPGGREAA